jgi:hypothetical protein
VAAEKTDTVESREAKHGQKMIEVKVRFWTDDITGEAGKIIPKHAWTSGVVRMERNEAHGIIPSSPVPFNSLLGMTGAIEKVLMEQGITLHPSRKDRRFIKDPPPKT